jgi:hypothetical protein
MRKRADASPRKAVADTLTDLRIALTSGPRAPITALFCSALEQPSLTHRAILSRSFPDQKRGRRSSGVAIPHSGSNAGRNGQPEKPHYISTRINVNSICTRQCVFHQSHSTEQLIEADNQS